MGEEGLGWCVCVGGVCLTAVNGAGVNEKASVRDMHSSPCLLESPTGDRNQI